MNSPIQIALFITAAVLFAALSNVKSKMRQKLHSSEELKLGRFVTFRRLRRHYREAYGEDLNYRSVPWLAASGGCIAVIWFVLYVFSLYR